VTCADTAGSLNIRMVCALSRRITRYFRSARSICGSQFKTSGKMCKFHRWLPNGSMLRNITILTGGTVFAQGLTVAALPVLTRLYSPSDFSLLAVYAAIVGILSVVACLRYNIAIPLPEDDMDGIALLAAALLATCTVSFLCALPVVLAPAATAYLIGQPELEPYLWMVPLGVFIASVYDSLQYWASRRKRFALVSWTRMTRAVGGIGAQLVLGAINPSPFNLIFGHMVYGGLGVVGLLRNLGREDNKLFLGLRPENILLQARTYHRFPLFSVPEGLFNTAGAQLPLVIVAAMLVGPEAGFLFLAMRAIGLPMSLVGSSAGQVFLAEAPEKLREKTLSTFTHRTMWSLFRTGAPSMLAIGLMSPLIFPLVFGPEWTRAGWLVLWMTPWFILQFVSSPVSMVMHILGRQDMAMSLQAFGLACRVGSVFAAIVYAPDYVSEIFATSGAVFYGLYILTITSVLRKADYK
jgi:O-antigen/teichoic acid export membrane protein